MVRTKKQWERQRREAQEALWAIEEKERAKRSATLVGKCFRYLNSYGSGDRWWLYARVISVGDGGYLTTFSFQTTCNDEIQIEPAKARLSIDGWEAISIADFKTAWHAVQKRIVEFTPHP